LYFSNSVKLGFTSVGDGLKEGAIMYEIGRQGIPDKA